MQPFVRNQLLEFLGAAEVPEYLTIDQARAFQRHLVAVVAERMLQIPGRSDVRALASDELAIQALRAEVEQAVAELEGSPQIGLLH